MKKEQNTREFQLWDICAVQGKERVIFYRYEDDSKELSIVIEIDLGPSKLGSRNRVVYTRDLIYIHPGTNPYDADRSRVK